MFAEILGTLVILLVGYAFWWMLGRSAIRKSSPQRAVNIFVSVLVALSPSVLSPAWSTVVTVAGFVVVIVLRNPTVFNHVPKLFTWEKVSSMVKIMWTTEKEVNLVNSNNDAAGIDPFAKCRVMERPTVNEKESGNEFERSERKEDRVQVKDRPSSQKGRSDVHGNAPTEVVKRHRSENDVGNGRAGDASDSVLDPDDAGSGEKTEDNTMGSGEQAETNGRETEQTGGHGLKILKNMSGDSATFVDIPDPVECEELFASATISKVDLDSMVSAMKAMMSKRRKANTVKVQNMELPKNMYERLQRPTTREQIENRKRLESTIDVKELLHFPKSERGPDKRIVLRTDVNRKPYLMMVSAAGPSSKKSKQRVDANVVLQGWDDRHPRVDGAFDVKDKVFNGIFCGCKFCQRLTNSSRSDVYAEALKRMPWEMRKKIVMAPSAPYASAAAAGDDDLSLGMIVRDDGMLEADGDGRHVLRKLKSSRNRFQTVRNEFVSR